MQQRLFGIFASLTIPIALAACGYRPPYPPPLHTTDYLEYRESPLPVSDDDVEVRIAGARLAEGGLYLDVLVHSQDRDEQRLRSLARHLGTDLSIHHPAEDLFLEMTDSDGRPLRLRSMKYPDSFTLGCRLYKRPPTHRLDDHRYIATCMFRTDRQLEPGTYRLRFMQGWHDQYFASVAEPVDYEWRELKIDWPLSPPDS